jgi:hypothetical protein
MVSEQCLVVPVELASMRANLVAIGADFGTYRMEEDLGILPRPPCDALLNLIMR